MFISKYHFEITGGYGTDHKLQRLWFRSGSGPLLHVSLCGPWFCFMSQMLRRTCWLFITTSWTLFNALMKSTLQFSFLLLSWFMKHIVNLLINLLSLGSYFSLSSSSLAACCGGAAWLSKDLILSALLHTLLPVGRKLTLGETMHEERPSYLQRSRMATEDTKLTKCLFVIVGRRERRGLIKKSVQREYEDKKKTKNGRDVSKTHAKEEVHNSGGVSCAKVKALPMSGERKNQVKSDSLCWDWAKLPPTLWMFTTFMSIVQHKSESVERRDTPVVDFWT